MDSEHLRSDEDVEEILRMAVRTVGTTTDDLRARLNAAAAELGISQSELAEAENRFRQEKKLEIERGLERGQRMLYRRYVIGEFLTHAATFVAVCAGLTFLDARDGSIEWVFWVWGIWGLAVVTDFVQKVVPSESNDRMFHRWRKRHQKRKVE